MPKGDKYLGLKKYLLASNEPRVILSFEEIEELIGDKLPMSAREHAESWWSNAESSSQATAWLDSGYMTDFVTETYNMQSIIFVKG